jgi:hypothetical protein
MYPHDQAMSEAANRPVFRLKDDIPLRIGDTSLAVGFSLLKAQLRDDGRGVDRG